MSLFKQHRHTNLIIFLLFITLLGLFKFYFHELWKDEWQAWLIATDTDTWAAMLKLLPAEGHPPLWYAVQRLFNNLADLIVPGIAKEHVLQTLHFLLTACSFYVFFTKFRLSVWLKVGLAFGYFLCFEYGIVNRGYILTILLIFLLAVLAEDIFKNYLKYSVALLLLCFTEVYGLFMALAFALFAILSYKQAKPKPWRLAVVVFSAAAGLLVFVLALFPGEGQAQSNAIHQLTDLEIGFFIKAFQAVMVNSFWLGTVDTVYKGVSLWGIVLSILILAGIIITINKDKKVLFTYLAFITMMYLFTAIFYLGGPRQWGMHVVFYVAILNLFLATTGKKNFNITGTLLVVSVIVFLGIHNYKILKQEKAYMYSNSILAGRYIKAHIPEDAPVYAVNKYYSTPVIGYADRKFLGFRDSKPFSYFIWREQMYIPDIRDIIILKMKTKAEALYVISYKPLDLNRYPGIKPVAAFDQPNIRQENYYLYRY